jgi:hypothetical protein
VYGGGYNVWALGNRDASQGFFNGPLQFGSINGADAAAQNLTSSVPLTRSGGVPSGMGDTQTSTNAFYVGWNQEWFRGIGTTFNYFYTGKGQSNAFLNSRNQLLASITSITPGTGSTYNSNNGPFFPSFIAPRQSITGVLNIPMRAFGSCGKIFRENDVIGVGYSAMSFRRNNIGDNFPQRARFNSTWEQVVEVYYKWAVNDAISVVPSFQLYYGSSGVRQNGTNVLVGLRTSYSF